MGLGLMTHDELKGLPVIQCKASKLFDGASKTYGQLEEILGGKSLDAFRHPFKKPNEGQPNRLQKSWWPAKPASAISAEPYGV